MTIDCQTAQEWIPAYVLDVLEADEQVALLQHMHECASCQTEADSLQPVVGVLGLSAPDAGVPAPRVKQRVIAAIHTPVKPRAVVQSSRRWTWRWAVVLVPAALALVLIVGLGAAAVSLQSQLTQQQARLDRLVRTQAALQQFMLAQNVQMVPVKMADLTTSATAMAYISGDKIAMSVAELPLLEGESVYQCWWKNTQTGEMEAGSFFKVDANGAGIWVWQMPPGGGYGQMIITHEDQSGKTKIDGPIVLTVDL